MSWRRELDKEVAQLSEQHTCELCGSAVEVVSSGEGTNSYRPVESERMAKLEWLVRNARPMVCSSRYVMVADNWLTRYDEMFPEVQ